MERKEMIDFVLNKVKECNNHIGIVPVITFGTLKVSTITNLSIYEGGRTAYMLNDWQHDDPASIQNIRKEILEKIYLAIVENKYL